MISKGVQVSNTKGKIMNRLEEIKTSVSEVLEEKISTRVNIMLSIYEKDKEAYLSKVSDILMLIPYEKEAVRRHYMELLYCNCEDIFSKMVADCNNKREIPVHFGEYMGETKYIGSV